MPFGSQVAVAVLQASSCSSYSAPSLGTSYAAGAALKRQKKKKKKKNYSALTSNLLNNQLGTQERLALPATPSVDTSFHLYLSKHLVRRLRYFLDVKL